MEAPLRSCAHYKYKMQQMKLNVIKRSKNAIFRGFGFADWFVGPEKYSKRAPKSF